ncbi:MAG: hypothetical protein CMP69_02960 [Flavobacteriales bacterium]|nr:hypothetical protein [Flavobacteriales bacterium]|tara:strand:- start:603 stop:1271 length:669 start_codon:yes stop_codon:yes gene_type:complete
MKKLFTILTVVILTTTVSFAQFSAKAGLNMANIASNNDDADMSMKLGLVIGGNYAIELSDEMSLDLSLTFKQSGAKETNDFQGGSTEMKWSLNYLDISPNLAYKVSDVFGFSAGPYLAYAISGTVKSEMKITNGPTTETSESIKFGDGDNDDGIKAMDFGINIGATYFINDMMNISAGYALGLTNLIYVDDDMKDAYDAMNEDVPSLKNTGIYLSFGYSFGG